MISPEVHVNHGFNLVTPHIVVQLSGEHANILVSLLDWVGDRGSLSADERVLLETLSLELTPVIEEVDLLIHTSEPA